MQRRLAAGQREWPEREWPEGGKPHTDAVRRCYSAADRSTFCPVGNGRAAVGGHDMLTIILIVLVVLLLFGGGGYYYRGRG
jgi:hypothetical protein